MRVLLAAPSMHVGGAEKLVLSLARELLARGETVAVSGPPGPLDDELPAGATRLRLPERGRSPIGAAANAVRLARLASGFHADVIHAHNVKVAATAAVGARLVPRRPRPRVVATFHGVVPAEYRPPRGSSAAPTRSPASRPSCSTGWSRRATRDGVRWSCTTRSISPPSSPRRARPS